MFLNPTDIKEVKELINNLPGDAFSLICNDLTGILYVGATAE